MMRSGATTPEELESLLEDAFVIGDRDAVVQLFDRGAVLVSNVQPGEARGDAEIARLATGLLRSHGSSYLAGPRQLLQARDIALVVADKALNVMRRRDDGTWRYLIALLSTTEKEQGMTETTLDAAAVKSGDGEAFGALAEIKATAADTGGQLTLVEMTHPPGYEAPLHVHHREDEAFWILDGDATFEVGDTTIEASAGDYAFGPRDIPHRYTVGNAGCRMLYVLTPGGFEDLIREMSEPATARTVPPPADGPPDMEWVQRIANKHGCELLG